MLRQLRVSTPVSPSPRAISSARLAVSSVIRMTRTSSNVLSVAAGQGNAAKACLNAAWAGVHR
jgi:hypothetical protein